MPAGHHLHFTETGFYLAHGVPSISDRTRYELQVWQEFSTQVEKLREVRVAKIRASRWYEDDTDE